jgi:Holliday junction resolvase RusA-like endonuclease
VVGELTPKAPRLYQDVEIVVPGRPPTLNARRHWRAIAKDNENWKAVATADALDARKGWESKHGLRWRPLRTARLTVTFIVPDHRRRDWDNLISTMKPELDGFVAAGILVDDSTDVISFIRFEVEYEKGVSATRVRIEELDDAGE